jgi:hypothetical protein
MTDLVERLRSCQGILTGDPDFVCADAADEVERLRAEVKAQRNRIASLKGLIADEEEAERL